MPGGRNNINGTDGKLFVKGDSRINTLGRPKKLNLDKYLRKVLMEKVNDIPAIKGILMKLRDQALDGDVRSAEMLLERAFGKAKQPIETSGPFAIIGIQYIVPENGNSNKTDSETTRSLECTEDAH